MKNMDSFEYAIKKDVRNNSIVRELDERRQTEQWKWIGSASLVLVVLLFAGWQRAELRRLNSKVGTMQRQMAVEEESGRHLLLDLEGLRSPKHIEQVATQELHMTQPGPADYIVIERAQPADPPAASVVARR